MQAARDAAISALVMIANDDEKETTEDRITAACAVIDATGPVSIPSQREQDEALRQVGQTVADVVLDRFAAADAKVVSGV